MKLTDLISELQMLVDQDKEEQQLSVGCLECECMSEFLKVKGDKDGNVVIYAGW